MYLVVPQLKNRQMEIERGCFLPIGSRRPQTSRRCHVNKSKILRSRPTCAVNLE